MLGFAWPNPAYGAFKVVKTTQAQAGMARGARASLMGAGQPQGQHVDLLTLSGLSRVGHRQSNDSGGVEKLDTAAPHPVGLGRSPRLGGRRHSHWNTALGYAKRALPESKR